MAETLLLLVGGDDEIQATVADTLWKIPGCQLRTADSSESALQSLAHERHSVVIYFLPADGNVDNVIDFSHCVSRLHARTPVVVVTAQDDRDVRVNLLVEGIVDCLFLPLNTSRLSFLVDLLTIRPRFEESHDLTHDCHTRAAKFGEFLPTSIELQQVLQQVDRVASLPITVLLLGETGTGKTHLARYLHDSSNRRREPFVAINCGALSATLMESEMFGHRRGAFTGAISNHIGKFQAAQKGTLFLDEIDSLPHELQSKLLRVVEQREFEPLGSNDTQTFDARLVVATNQSLEKAVEAGKFRGDLYHRLNVVSFSLPPLRNHAEAIEPLATAFLEAFSVTYNKSDCKLSPTTLAAMKLYSWPGNVRELRNTIERAVALSDSHEIQPSDLPLTIQASEVITSVYTDAPRETPESHENELAHVRFFAERQRLEEALRGNNNNRSHAAQELGISRVTLYKKLRKHKLM